MQFVILGIYVIVVVGLFAYLSIVLLHLRGFTQYSKYLKGVTRIYVILLIVITIFGIYKILGGDVVEKRSLNSINTQY